MPYAIILFSLAEPCWSATWVIVRKDGARIECEGPFVIVNGVYTFRTAAGKNETLPESEVNASQTAAANASQNKETPAVPQRASVSSAPIADETAYDEALRLQGLLQARRFQELNSFFEQRQSEFEKDFRLEAAVADWFDVLVQKRPGIEPILDDWVRQFPASWVPLIARGYYLYNRGWDTRGTNFAYQTTDAQFASLAGNHQQASMDFKKALQLNPKLVVAYQILISMAKASSDAGEGSRQYLQRALELCPRCYEVRRQYLVELEPRWRGSYEEMGQFAAESQRSDNPQLRALYGSSYWDSGNVAQNAGRFDEAIQLYTTALSYGEYWAYYYGRGAAAGRIKRYKEAADDLNRAIALRPTRGDPYIDRAICNGIRADFSAARRDITTARLLPHREDWLTYVDKWLSNYARK